MKKINIKITQMKINDATAMISYFLFIKCSDKT